jgi:ketosteroid isomerase-like protein
MRGGTRSRRLLAAALLIGGIAAGRGAWASSSDDDAAIRKALQDWVRNFNSGDYLAAATVWAPDVVGWWGPPNSPVDTFERELEAAKQPIPPGAPKTTFELAIDEIIITGDLAVVRDTWVEATRPPDALTPKRKTFRSFEVWRRQPDRSWKIARWIDGPEMELPTAPHD